MKQYTDPKVCKADLLLARETFGSTNTTEAQYDAMEKSLAFMYLYCPEELMTDVHATLLEAERRRMYFELNIWSKQCQPC